MNIFITHKQNECLQNEVHHVLQTTKNIAPEVVKVISKIGADCAMAMKLNFSALHPDYVPTAEPCEPSTKRQLGNFFLNLLLYLRSLEKFYNILLNTCLVDTGGHFMLPGTIVNNAIKKMENRKRKRAPGMHS